jgi:hypothetical protein
MKFFFITNECKIENHKKCYSPAVKRNGILLNDYYGNSKRFLRQRRSGIKINVSDFRDECGV